MPDAAQFENLPVADNEALVRKSGFPTRFLVIDRLGGTEFLILLVFRLLLFSHRSLTVRILRSPSDLKKSFLRVREILHCSSVLELQIF
jgi:hypothetical protein